MNPTDAQLAARLNPTPVNIQTPTNAGFFRAIGDNGDAIYQSQGGALKAYSLGGGNNYDSNIQNLAKYGIDWNSLPTQNIADLYQQNGGRPAQWGDLTSLPLNQPSLTTQNTTINNTPNQLSALASQGTQGATYPAQQTNASYGSLGGQTSALQNTATGRTPVTLGNGQQVFIDQTGQAYDASGNQVSNQTIGQSTAGSSQVGAPASANSASAAGAYGGAGGGGTPTGTPVSSTPFTDNYLQQYLQGNPALQNLVNAEQTPQNIVELQAQQAALDAKLRAFDQSSGQMQLNVEGQPIAQGFISGQQAAIAKQSALDRTGITNDQQTLQQRLATAQARQQSAIDVAKSIADYSKPTSVALGSSLVNPITGATISSGALGSGQGTGISPQTGLPQTASGADILGYLVQNGVPITRYNTLALVTAVQNGATAQDIISGKVNVASQTAAGTSGSSYKLNPLTGQYIQPNPSTSSPVLGTPSSGSGAYQAGQLTKLLQSQGQVPQGQAAPDSLLKSLWAKYGDGSTYQNNTADNSKIYNAINGGQSASSASSVGGNTASAPNDLPTPTNYAQKAYSIDFTSGGLSDRINAQNTAVGHLSLALQIGQDLQNFQLQPANAGKNFWESATGKADLNNYNQVHVLSADELSAAYGADTGSERTLNAAIGGANSSPQQIRDYAKTASQALTSKILSNIQQYKTAYGQNAPLNLAWFINPGNQNNLKQLGIVFQQNGNEVGAYQMQPDGSGKLIQ